jgi:GNAT superfamily N-acetyltransferase
MGPVDERRAWAVVCFVVSKGARGRGIARALLGAAIAYVRAHGAEVLEAYPEEVHDGRISDARAFKGILPMFERAGFRVVARRRASAASAERPMVRLELA